MSINKNDREIPKKNYFVVIVVSILVIVVTLYVRNFYLTYKYVKSNNSIFNDKAVNQINSNDFKFALSEIKEGIIYVSKSGSLKINNMERKLYKEVENKDLFDIFIYWNITEVDKKVVSEKLLLSETESVKVPMLIYVKDGEIVEIIDSSEKMIDNNSLDYMLTKYGIE